MPNITRIAFALAAVASVVFAVAAPLVINSN
jgi:hypothetical protein